MVCGMGSDMFETPALLRAWVRGVRSHVRHTRVVWGGIGGVRGSRVAREAHARDGGLQEGHTRRVRVGAL